MARLVGLRAWQRAARALVSVPTGRPTEGEVSIPFWGTYPNLCVPQPQARQISAADDRVRGGEAAGSADLVKDL